MIACIPGTVENVRTVTLPSSDFHVLNSWKAVGKRLSIGDFEIRPGELHVHVRDLGVCA